MVGITDYLRKLWKRPNYAVIVLIVKEEHVLFCDTIISGKYLLVVKIHSDVSSFEDAWLHRKSLCIRSMNKNKSSNM